MKKLFALIVLAALVSGCIGQPTAAPAAVNETANITAQPTTGTFSLYMKDVIQNIPGYGKVTGMNLTVESVQVYYDKWVPLTNEAHTFDVIGLGADEKELLFSGMVDAGDYSKIKVVLGDSNIKMYNYNMTVWNKTYPLTPDPAEVTIDAAFTVSGGEETSLTLDLDVPSSVTKLPCDLGNCYYLKPPTFNVVR